MSRVALAWSREKLILYAKPFIGLCLFPLLYCELLTILAGADLGGGCRGCAPPPPPRDDLRLSNTTGILQKKKLCGLLVLK